jgi:hypothetical protein
VEPTYYSGKVSALDILHFAIVDFELCGSTVQIQPCMSAGRDEKNVGATPNGLTNFLPVP